MLKGILLTDGSVVGLKFAESLAKRAQQIEIGAVVVSPRQDDGQARKVAELFPNGPLLVRSSKPHTDPALVDMVATGTVDFVFSCWYDYRIRSPILDGARRGGVNVHPAALPHNGGRHSAFWGLVDGTPLGATVHWMTENFDDGDIIAQATFEDDGLMNAEYVYDRQVELCLELFDSCLPMILGGTAPRVPQDKSKASYHFQGDIAKASTFDIDQIVSLRHLLRVARGTTAGTHGFYVTDGGRRFKVQTKVIEA